MMISVALSVDILAIRCVDRYIILGIGSQLKVFRTSDFELLLTVDTSHQDAVHNLVKSSNKLIAFGGRYLSIFRMEITSNQIHLVKESHHVFDDWIIAAEFFDVDSDNIYILFAHNNLYLFNALTKRFTNVWCQERCILYGGYLSRENPDEIIIFSCTVFQEILLWNVNNKIEYSSDVPVLHRLRGHRGVIFSVFYKPRFKLITSTSDDRTIRLWQVTETQNEDSRVKWENAEIKLLTTMFGHTARVWRSIIVQNRIISIGEDSLICIWSLDGQLCNKIIGHEGATIWSIEASEENSMLITGGGDGAVNTWSFSSLETPSLVPKFTYEGKTPKFVGYLNSGALLVFVDGGELLLYDQTDELKICSSLPRYKSYCLMQISPNRKTIAFASQEGFVDIFEETSGDPLHLNRLLEEKVVDSKIFALHWLNDEKLLICGSQGHLKLLKLCGNKTSEEAEFTLPPSKERWTTSAIILKTLLICGDRAGSVYVFQVDPFISKNPKQTFLKIHGRLGVQSFGNLGAKLISTGRDGTLRYYKIVKNDVEVKLETLHWKKMPMEWVSRILKTDTDVYILGFKEVEFMIYSTSLNRLTLRIVCGGGHRSWDCIFKNNIVNFVCIKDKQVHVLNNTSCETSKTIIPGFHTKEIHSLAVLPNSKNHTLILSGGEDCSIRISALEPTKTSTYQFRPLDAYDGHISNVKSIAILNLESSEKLSRNLVFSGGGRAQLKVWEISVDVDKDVIGSDDVMGVELTSFMLRGTDKDRRKISQNNKQLYFMDPETRFVDISAYLCPQDGNSVILFVACSDGFIRVLLYRISLNELKLVTRISYFNRCILKLHSFLHDEELILISMATDGFVNFWNVQYIVNEIFGNDKNEVLPEDGISPFGRWRAHQSGINSYDFRKTSSNHCLVASGGDDNKVNLCAFKISGYHSKTSSLELLNNWESSSIHFAQITGIKFVADDQLLSAAIDQRVVLYHYTYSNEELSVMPIKVIKTFVSDMQGLLLCDNPKNSAETFACIHGQGLEVIRHQNKSLNC